MFQKKKSKGKKLNIDPLIIKNYKLSSQNFQKLQICPLMFLKFENWSIFSNFQSWSKKFKIYKTSPKIITMNELFELLRILIFLKFSILSSKHILRI